MPKTLHLQAFQQVYLDVELLDGSIIHLKKPTQRLAIEMALLPQYLVQQDINVIVTALNELTVNILDNNKEGRIFTLDSIKDWEVELKNALINAYQEFLCEILANPN